MKRTVLLFLCVLSPVTSSRGGEALRLHPENPHYFLFRGEPTILITSGEHYGAVLNLDFDYTKYLDTLAADRLNNTRTFSGAYVEPQGAFNIERNTLAPGPNRFICPWARSSTPGYTGGGNRFDLSRWDGAYFRRLVDFVAQASKRGITVEMNLFCPMYGEEQWKLSPMNAINNVNGVGGVAMTDVYTLDRHGGLLPVQDAMVRKIVAELRDFDNVYYEIANEPYFGGVTIPWQHHIAEVIVDAQKDHTPKKLISQNIANNSARIENPHPAVSIFNFHYASPPDAVAMNYHLDKVIGDNETGFRGTKDEPYRMEAWDFILAGGGLFNHLDYSFTVGHEDGTYAYPSTQPGGGNPGFRRQMKILRDFIHGFDFIRMVPDSAVIKGGVPPGMSARALVEPGRACAVYLRPHLVTRYSVRWTGEIEPGVSEEITFHTFSNDGVRLWVDGKPVIDDWTEHSEKETTGKITLEAGKRYPLRLEYFYNGGMAAMKLWWSSRSRPKGPVPSDRLWTPDRSGHGLRGEYFTGRNFDRPWQTRNDARVDFAWGTESPFPVPKREGAVGIEIELAPGAYRAEWLDTRRGTVEKAEDLKHAGGVRRFVAPRFTQDIALGVRKTSS